MDGVLLSSPRMGPLKTSHFRIPVQAISQSGGGDFKSIEGLQYIGAMGHPGAQSVYVYIYK